MFIYTSSSFKYLFFFNYKPSLICLLMIIHLYLVIFVSIYKCLIYYVRPTHSECLCNVPFVNISHFIIERLFTYETTKYNKL